MVVVRTLLRRPPQSGGSSSDGWQRQGQACRWPVATPPHHRQAPKTPLGDPKTREIAFGNSATHRASRFGCGRRPRCPGRNPDTLRVGITSRASARSPFAGRLDPRSLFFIGVSGPSARSPFAGRLDPRPGSGSPMLNSALGGPFPRAKYCVRRPLRRGAKNAASAVTAASYGDGAAHMAERVFAT